MKDHKQAEAGTPVHKKGGQNREEFLAVLAHELRDPLAPICAGLELLKLARDKLGPYDEIIGMMERQTHQLVTLVDHLVDISHIRRGTLLLKKSKVKLADIIQEALQSSSSCVSESGLELVLSEPAKTIYLEADPQRLAQALANLLRSAARFARGGGQLRLSVQRQGGLGVIALGYEGQPVPENRLQPTHSPGVLNPGQEASSPIGLSLVYSLAELHGGSLEILRKEHGSDFILKLPILEIMSADFPPSSVEAQGHRVLIVDDNRDAAQMLGKVIELLGNESRTANDGRAAVEIASSFRPHVILMDLDMPEMDGYQAARLIRRQAWGANLTLVALTGWSQKQDRQRSIAAGFDDHLIKPVEPYALHKLLSAVPPPRRP